MVGAVCAAVATTFCRWSSMAVTTGSGNYPGQIETAVKVQVLFLGHLPSVSSRAGDKQG